VNNWHEQRRRDELSERIRKQEENRDHELEQDVIAYHAHRASGGTMKWADFRRDRLKATGRQEHYSDR
jgi:hypothetical protein